MDEKTCPILMVLLQNITASASENPPKAESEHCASGFQLREKLFNLELCARTVQKSWYKPT